MEVAALLHHRGNKQLLLEIGNNYRVDRLCTELSLATKEGSRYSPIEYANNLNYSINDLSALLRYSHAFSSLSLSLSLKYRILFLKKQLSDLPAVTETRLRLDPTFALKWQPSRRNTLLLAYSYRSSAATIDEIYSNAVLTGYRTLKRGLGDLFVPRSSFYSMLYTLGDWTDDLILNL